MKQARGFVSLVVAVVAAAGLAVLPMSEASAQQSSVGGSVAASWQTNNVVYAIAAADNVVYVGGDFDQVRPPGAAAGTSQTPRSRLAAFNATTGALITTWDHPVNGAIRSLALSPDRKTLYLGGDFTTVDGAARSRAAAITLGGNGTLSSWNPSPDGRVNAVTASGSQVFLGGSFGRIGTAGRRWVAAVNNTTGALRTGFAPVLDSTVYALDATAAGDRLYVGGAFKSVGGDTTWHGAVALSTTDASVQPFSAISAIPTPSDACTSVVRSITHDGSSTYFGDEGTGGGCFDGTFAANTDGSLKWKSSCLGATQGIAVLGGQLYAGSHAHDCSGDQGFDPDAFPEVGWSKGLSRHLTNRSTSDGTVGAWSPNTNGGTGGALGPRVIATDGNQIYVGGEFTTVNGAGQQGFARFPSTSTSAPARPAAPRAVTVPGGKVNVFLQSPLDLDDKDLVVRLYRDGETSPFVTKPVHVMFWRDPIASVQDTGLAVGSQHTYSADVTEANGTLVSPRSAASNRVTVASSAGAYSDAVNADSPSLFWRLGEGTGSSVAADSGNKLVPGEVKGKPTFGQAGQTAGDTAAGFDGATTNVVTQDQVDGPQAYSVEAWFKTSSTTGGKIIGFGNNRTGLDFSGNTTVSGNYDRNVYMSNDGTLTFGSYDNGFNVISSSAAYNDGQWHYVVGTQSPAAGTTMYVDGAKIGHGGNGNNQSYAGYWRVGGDNLGAWPNQPTSNFFSGTIDDVAVYPTVLNRSQMVSHYTASGRTAPAGPTAPADAYGKAVYDDSPVNFWRLDDTSGTVARDSSENQDDGVIVGNPTLGGPSAITGVGTSIGFDGNDDNVASGSATSVGATFSTEAWFRSQPGTGGGKIVGFGGSQTGGSGSYDKHTYLSDDGRVVFGVWNNQADVVTSQPGYNDGAWHQVVSTQGPGGMRLYVDDKLVDQNTVSTNQGYSGYWRVGGDTLNWPYQSSSKYFQGDIDEVGIYGSVLSAGQVDSHFRASGRSGPDTVAPDVAVTAPANGSTVAVGDNVIRVDATDDTAVSSVEVFVDGTSVGTDTAAPYALQWQATAGQHTIVAKATDGAGNTSSSTPVTVTAAAPDTTAPTVKITSPADGAQVYGAFTVSADAADADRVASVTFKADGATIGTDTTAPYSADWSTKDVGSHTLTATAVDPSGNTATDTVTVSVAADTTAPTAPTQLTASGVTTSSATLSWQASTDDRGDVAGYRVVQDGRVLPGTVTGTSTTVSGLTPATTYAFTVRAVDAAGNVSADSAPVSVTTDKAAPPAPTTAFTDDWNRADAASWGANWAVSSVNGSVTTSGGTGVLSNNDVAGAYGRAILTGLAAKTDTETLLSFTWKQPTALSYLNLYVRGSGGWQNSYRPRNALGLQLTSTSTSVEVQQNVNGVLTTLRRDSGAVKSTTAKQWLRLRVQGGSLQYRIWTDGTTEPTTWSPAVTNVGVTGPGQLHLAVNRASTNVGAKSVVVDDLSITDLTP
ncbi:MAG: cell surface protein [Marmoricola sp.]|nr:cell surface protein [Marmoricola sp.]